MCVKNYMCISLFMYQKCVMVSKNGRNFCSNSNNTKVQPSHLFWRSCIVFRFAIVAHNMLKFFDHKMSHEWKECFLHHIWCENHVRSSIGDSNPYEFWYENIEGSVRSSLTFPKMGLGSPSGLLKTQRVIAGVKTPRIKAFFIPLERSWSVNVQNDLAWAIWTSTAQVMVKRRARSQIGNLTPDH